MTAGSETVLGKLWQEMDGGERCILAYLAFMASPVSVDTLILLSGASAVTILKVMAKLRKKKIVSQERASGEGIYFVNNTDLAQFVQGQISQEETQELLRRSIDYSLQPSEKPQEATLALAGLYLRLGEGKEHLEYIRKAADILYRSGRMTEAIPYYDYIIDQFAEKVPEQAEVDHFLESVYRKVSFLWHQMPLPEMLAILKKGHATAKANKQANYLARMTLLLSLALMWAGQGAKASLYTNDFRKLAGSIDNPRLQRTAVLLTSVLIHLEGRVSEATQYYEKMTGNLEQFGDDEESLLATVFIAGSHVACGRIARGMGMFDAVRAKAVSLKLEELVHKVDIGTIIALLEIRRVTEVESRLERLLTVPEIALDRNSLGFLYNCRAYILYSRKDYKGAFDYLVRGFEYLNSMGRAANPFCPWIFECLHSFELNGLIDENINFDSQIKRAIDGDNLYIKGAAFRYRALKNIERGAPSDLILLDLAHSKRCLKTAGGKIELARTYITLGEFFLGKGKMRAAHGNLQKAWDLFSTIDKDLFPEHLLGFLSAQEKTAHAIERITRINESLGTLRDTSSFLERVINVAMDISMATRGAFLVTDSDGVPRIAAGRNIDDSLMQGDKTCSPIMEIVYETVRKGGEVVPQMDGLQGRAALKTELDSVICMPAKLDEKVYGYLYVDKPFGGRPFSLDDIPFFRILCSQTAVGLDNISMHRELTEQKERSDNEVIFYRREIGAGGLPHPIVGGSEPIKRIMEQIDRVAPTDSSVLIIGETGVGKELVAKAIHNGSTRKNGPFIPVNLATLPQDLVASELFGHEMGAFTGARVRQKGRLELADGGTIFLDEIGDLSPAIQIKLLRVLQEKTFERLGSSEPIKSDFRIISATNKDLIREVEKGTFRQDLYYRLNVFPIHVPPLRDRSEDIPVLAHHFLEVIGRRMGKTIGKIPVQEFKKLDAYHWPGNVRELEHFIERALILSDGHHIVFSGLERTPSTVPAEGDMQFKPLAEMVRQYLENVLHATRWRVKGPHGAAMILGLKPTTLFSLMKRHGIQRSRSHDPDSKV